MFPRFAAVMIAGLLAPLAANAAPVKLAETNLTDAKDWDRVMLPPCATSSNVAVTKVGVRVTKHPAQIDRLKVVFHNGTQQELSVKHHFLPGGQSRWIDLRGEARCIKSIRIVGDADTRGWRPGKQAHVSFWAQAPSVAPGASVAPRGAVPRGAAKGPRFRGPPSRSNVASAGVGTRLGMVQLRDAKDWDYLRLGNCPSNGNKPVTQLKVQVKKYPATINKLGVVFHNGERQELTLRKHFAAGSASVWHDLRGAARCIKSVHIIGDTDSIGWRPGKQASVVFLGK